MQTNKKNIAEEGWVLMLFTSALYLFFIADGITKLLMIKNIEFSRVSILIRSVYQVLFFFTIGYFIDTRRRAFLIFLLLVILCWAAGVYSFAFYQKTDYPFFQNIIILNKYLYAFVVFYTGYKLINNPAALNKVLKVLELIFLINSTCCILGVLTRAPIFEAFPGQSYRFGYNGLIFANNEAVVFYFLAVCYFYYKCFLLGNSSRRDKWCFYIVATGSLFLGSKGYYFFLLSLAFYHVFFVARGLAKVIFFVMLSIALTGIVIFFLSEQGQAALSFMISMMERDGVWSMLLSSRDVLAAIKIPIILENWTFWNVLFGGQNQFLYLLEMDVLDLFFFFGIVGCILMMILYFNTIFNFKAYPFFIFYISIYFILSALGGHILYSALNALYLCLVSFYFIQTSNKVKNGGDKEIGTSKQLK
ncbi:hypothetical protein [Chitinophaga sp. HK235]|uniref:hypothetical protein n=1 Tax=Chitinophaga sp. HK235 TaxID=2952571 RepID=UPI001BA77AFA|nr:hypothetical protein [Chitinophaga sp. HK235]